MNPNLSNNLKVLYGEQEIQKSLNTETIGFEKGGKRAEIGEVRTYSGQKWVKHTDGWVHINDSTGKHTLERPGGKRESASEEHISHVKTHIDRHNRESSMTKDSNSSGILTEDQVRDRVKKEQMTSDEEDRISSERGLKDKQNKIDKHVQAMNDGATEEEADQIANGKRNEVDHSGKKSNKLSDEKKEDIKGQINKYVSDYKNTKEIFDRLESENKGTYSHSINVKKASEEKEKQLNMVVNKIVEHSNDHSLSIKTNISEIDDRVKRKLDKTKK